MENNFNSAPHYKSLLDKLEYSRENYFITGVAGTGKSTLLQYFEKNSSKKVVLLAPTGRAALNIGGQTIHSFFRLPFGVIDVHQLEEKFIFNCKGKI